MHLDHLLCHLAPDPAGQVLGGRDVALAGLAVGFQRRGGEHQARPQLLDLDQHVDHAVLQHLVCADRLAELGAGLEELQR